LPPIQAANLELFFPAPIYFPDAVVIFIATMLDKHRAGRLTTIKLKQK